MELISREEAIRVIRETPCAIATENAIKINAIRGLPTIESRPKGKWIIKLNEGGYYAECPFCELWFSERFINTNGEIDTHNYCPNCGADMRGKAE